LSKTAHTFVLYSHKYDTDLAITELQNTYFQNSTIGKTLALMLASQTSLLTFDEALKKKLSYERHELVFHQLSAMRKHLLGSIT